MGVYCVKIRKVMPLLLAAVLALLGCAKKNMQTDVTLQVGELWEITEESIFETADTTFRSRDSTVATLRSGKYIYGGKAGETTIEAQTGKETHAYHVTVLPDESIQEYRTGGTWGEEPENALLIGYGFNALENEDCTMQTINLEAGCMFDWQSVLFSGNLTVDSSIKTTANAYTGSSLGDFCRSYKTKDSVPQTFSMFDRNLENKKIFKGVNITQSSLKSINQAYFEISKERYMFTEDADGYFSYLLPEVQDALMGFDGTTAEEYRDIISIPYIWDLNVKDTRDLMVYLGSGVNMITCAGLPSLDDLTTSQNILSINAIKKLVHSGDNKILRDKSVVSNYLNIYGTSAQEYSDSYKQEISGALGVGVGNNLVGLKAELSLHSEQTKEET